MILNLSENINQELLRLKEVNNYRFLRNAPDEIINVSSNDYLGISKRLDLQQEFFQAIQKKNKFQLSSASSRLLSGNHDSYDILESLMSALFNGRQCLIFNSGYHANIGILPAIVQSDDLIISDKLVHASIIDGIRLSKCKSERFRHLDYRHLEQIIIEKKNSFNNIFVVTESIFSMDGDEADLKILMKLKSEYGFYLYLDEAHAFGVRGNSGLGCAEENGMIDNIDFIIGTYGKAIASAGAFVICNENIREFLINKSRSLIFSTALPPLNIAWTAFIIERLKGMTIERAHLKTMTDLFIKTGKNNNLIFTSKSQIFPLIIGSNSQAILFSGQMLKAGVNALPVRYPTVPEGTARIRFSITSGLNANDIIKIIENTARIKMEI